VIGWSLADQCVINIQDLTSADPLTPVHSLSSLAPFTLSSVAHLPANVAEDNERTAIVEWLAVALAPVMPVDVVCVVVELLLDNSY
jgi:hypothetical protein